MANNMTLDLGHSSQNFGQNQQGSVDWVELGTSTISASVSVLRRIAAADIHDRTLTVAHAVAGTFWLSRTGEGRVGETLLVACSLFQLLATPFTLALRSIIPSAISREHKMATLV